MPVQIGATTHSFSEPTGLLSDCHRRIESFLGVLEAVGKTLDQPLTEEVARALGTALAYFHDAAPKHTADEEESLFPRLRRLHDPGVRAAMSQLQHLEEDHRAADPLHAQVERLGRKYLAAGKLGAPEVAEYRDAVARLRAIYAQHIRLEDEVVFPLAQLVLPKAEKSAIAAEMAGRRQAPLVTGPAPPK
ncbi:MAG TPA: hemerythrin domain-containing protein [Terriglobales bacterium]|nr:hemerythrin domain-containing protein [Terriglobales bacterium]